MLLSIVLMSLGFIFLVLFFLRYSALSKAVEVRAKVVNVSEGIMEILDRFNSYTYFFPEIYYQYIIDGKLYNGNVGKKQARLYRVSELDTYGGKRDDSSFFWRGLKTGDTIDILVDKKLKNSKLSLYENKSIASENKVFLVLSALFIFLSVCSFFFSG